MVDCGLKAFGMDHGNPSVEGYEVFFCSDEHTTFLAGETGALPAVGDRLRMIPRTSTPPSPYHERLHLVDGDEVIDTWPSTCATGDAGPVRSQT